jgi:hypothetical protein
MRQAESLEPFHIAVFPSQVIAALNLLVSCMELDHHIRGWQVQLMQLPQPPVPNHSF